MSGSSYCMAVNCTNSKKKNPQLTFFSLPKDIKMAQKWIEFSGRTDIDLDKHYTMCSVHFSKKQFKSTSPRVLLALGSIPHLNGPTSDIQSEHPTENALNEAPHASTVDSLDGAVNSNKCPPNEENELQNNNGISPESGVSIDNTSAAPRSVGEKNKLDCNVSPRTFSPIFASDDETPEKDISKVVIVNEDDTESGVDSSTLNCLKLEITNNSDDEYMELGKDDGNDKATDSLLLNNIKEELIEDSEEEFEEFLVDDVQYETGESRPKKLRNYTESKRRKCHTCEICGYESFQKSHYRRHLTIHSKPIGIQCSICRKHMTAKAELTNHVEEHRCISDRDRFQCHLCSYSSKKLTNVSQHTEVHFKPEKVKFKCEMCDFFTTNRALHKKHVNMHKSSRTNLKCPVCLVPFKTMASRRKHMQKYRSLDDPSKIQCPECPYNTAIFNHFKTHMVVHRNDEIEVFLCPYCPVKSKRKADLRQHIIVKHMTKEDVKLFGCDFCSYETRRRDHLVSHMKNRHSSDLVMKNCGLCSYKTVSQVLINKHCNIHCKVTEQVFQN